MATKPLVSKVHDKLDKLEMDTRKAIKEKPENGKFLVDEFTKRVNDIATDGLTDDQKKEYKSAVDKKVKDLTALAKSLTEKKNMSRKNLKEGRLQIYQDMENEYFQALKKAEENGTVSFTVEDDEFDTFEEAKSYAEEIGANEIEVSSFAICYGAYCDNEYDEYNKAILDLDGRIVRFTESLKNKKPMKENRGNKMEKKVMEAVEEVGKTRGQDVPMGCGKAGDMCDCVHAEVDVTFADAVNQDKENRKRMGKMWKDMEKDAKDVTPKDPDAPMKEKNMFTEKLTLDESLFETVEETPNKSFAKNIRTKLGESLCEDTTEEKITYTQMPDDYYDDPTYEIKDEVESFDIIIDGGRDYTDFGDEKLIKVVHGDYYDDDENENGESIGYDYEVLDELKKLTGKDYADHDISGYSQGEWVTLYAPVDTNQDVIEELENLYFGKYDIFRDEDNVGVRVPHDVSWKGGRAIKKYISDYTGDLVDNIVLKKFTGYKKTPEYGDFDESLKEDKTSLRDRVDAKRDNRVERARARFNKVRDDADAQRDDRLKKRGLQEKNEYPGWRHMSDSERHNARMNRIFDRFEQRIDDQVKFLIAHGVSEEEARKLKANTGLGKNAVSDKLVELGLEDEYWKTVTESLKKELEEAVAESRKSRESCSKELTEAPIYDLAPQYDARQSFYNKAKVDTGDNNDKNKLYSYNTLVAEIKDGKPVVYGTFSATTLRHIKEWLKQNGFKAENSRQIMADYGVKEECAK